MNPPSVEEWIEWTPEYEPHPFYVFKDSVVSETFVELTPVNMNFFKHIKLT